ncbi:hypothetical protein JCM10207_001326 [Rhodosporidiobolus poonsookiae]
MSLLTDKDFLLHNLHLSYIRTVLPAHAPHSAITGTNTPYNLVSFPPADKLANQSPYIARSGLADEAAFPELASGRNSPPLALQLGRGGAAGADGAGEAGAGAGRRERRRGPGPLQYTQTIVGKGQGSGLASAGMRVREGRPRTWKGKGRLEGAEEGAEAEEGSVEREKQTPSLRVETGGFGARPDEHFLRSQQLSAQQPPHLPSQSTTSDALHPLPPNVVVHSPVRTPHDSPTTSPRPFSPSFASFGQQQQRQPSRSPPRSVGDSTQAADPSGEDLSGSPTSRAGPASPPSRRPRFADGPPSVFSHDHNHDHDPDLPSSPASPSDFPPRPLLSQSLATTASSLGTSTGADLDPSAPTSPAVSSSAGSSPEVSPSPSPLATPAGEDSDAFAPPVGASVASSGVSLFGPSSRLTGGLVALGVSDLPSRDRSDSETSSLAQAPSPAPAPPPPAEPAPPPTQQPVFQLPPGLRVRERRRVNLRPGRMLVPPPAQALGSVEEGRHEEAAHPPAVKEDEAQERERANSDPPVPGSRRGSLVPPLPAVPAVPAEPPSPRSRKSSAPPAMLQPPSPARSPSSSPSRPPDTDTTPAQALAPPSTSASSQSQSSPRSTARSRRSSANQGLFFPPRGIYIRHSASSSSRSSAAGAPKSALSALLSAQSTASASSAAQANPWSTLYQSCISRAVDGLKLTLYFPHSSSPSKGLKVSVKRDVTVEEVIGAGLWSFVDEGREPKLEETEEQGWEGRARRGEETARWNLRIVEDDGEVDEDFPALDRTRNVSAFSFNEFAIVRAVGEQIADNTAKQSTLVRRPSRILSAPVPSAAPTPKPPASPTDSTPAPATPASVTIPLKVRIPPARVREEEPAGELSVEVRGEMYLSEVLDLILSRLPPFRPYPGVPPIPLSPNDYALLLYLSDSALVLPLDRTVASVPALALGGAAPSGAGGAGAPGAGMREREVVLVPKSAVGSVGLGWGVGGAPPGVAEQGRRGDRAGDVQGDAALYNPRPRPQPAGADEHDPTAQQQAAIAGLPYQHYNVLRKVPLSLSGRHYRTIAIDGDYLHFMPSSSRLPGGAGAASPTAGSGRTTSIHISAVRACRVSRRSANSFKIVVHTKGIDKRYDFEAESPQMAREIVERVREVMEMYGAGGRARR